MVIGSPFLIAGGKTSALFEAIDQPLDTVALAIGRAVEARGGALVHFVGDHGADTPSSQRLPDFLSAVALVADQAAWTQAWPTAPSTLDSSTRGQGRQCYLVVALATGQDKDDRFALALDPDMDFGAEPASRAVQRFGRWVPFFAPAAC